MICDKKLLEALILQALGITGLTILASRLSTTGTALHDVALIDGFLVITLYKNVKYSFYIQQDATWTYLTEHQSWQSRHR